MGRLKEVTSLMVGPADVLMVPVGFSNNVILSNMLLKYYL